MQQLPLAARQELDGGHSQTCLWLPRDRATASGLQLQERLDPATLLFLRKIRRIMIVENGTRKHVWIEHQNCTGKSDVSSAGCGSLRICNLHIRSEPVAEESRADFEGESQPTRYFQFTRSFDTPPHLGEKTSEVSIAFLDTDEHEPQNIFTFLPVCCSGFPFLLHATFDLVSSRQAIRADSPYNLWLRDQVASVFSTAMDVCDELRHRLPGLLSAFAVLDPFWRPVVRGIMQEIRGTACIQTESLSWVRPEEAILRPSSVGESLVSNHCLQSACDGLEFVADSMREMAETLGCAELGLEHMIAVAHQRLGNLPWQCNLPWLCGFMGYLNRFIGSDEVATVWDFPMFEIDGFQQRGTSLADGPIFASIPDKWRYVLKSQAVRVLSRDFMDQMRENPACMELLETCGIRSADAQSVACAILTQHRAGTFEREEACWHGLQFIRDNLSEILCSDGDSGHPSSVVLDDLKASLCIPDDKHGVLMAPSQLTLRGVLGVTCPCVETRLREESAEQPIQPPRSCTFVGRCGTATTPRGTITGATQRDAPWKTDTMLMDAAKWDYFFVTIGVALHSSCCTQRSAWTDCAEEEVCAICLESLPRSKASSILPCSHRFHADCIIQWSASQRDDQTSCPMCRGTADLGAIREVAPDAIFTDLSITLSGALAMTCAAPSGYELLARTALRTWAEDADTRPVLASVLVPTSLGANAIRNCWDPSLLTNQGSGTPMSRLLPSIALPGYNAMAASSKDPELTALFSDIGMCTTSTLDGLLHAGCVMRQQVIDGCTLAPNVVMQAFAGLYTALHSMVLSVTTGTGSSETATAEAAKLQAAFREQSLIFCGGSTFCRTDEAIWEGQRAVVDAVGTNTLRSLYGPILEDFFTNTVGVKSVAGAQVYWGALAQLCEEHERNPALASRAGYAEQLTEQVTLIYGELEKLLQAEALAPGRGGQGDTMSETMAAANPADQSGHRRSGTGGVCLLVRCTAGPYPARRVTRVVRLSDLTMPVLINDDDYAYDIVADDIESWLVAESLAATPKLLSKLCGARPRPLVRKLSESVRDQGDIVVAEPVAREEQWTRWAREFVESACTEYCQRPSQYALRLASTLTVLRSHSISSSVTIQFGDIRPPLEKMRSYHCITDQDSGRIVLSSQRAQDLPALCHSLGNQLSGLLAEMHDASGARVLEWNAYAFFMRKCGLQPRPLSVHTSSTGRIDGFYRGVRSYGRGGRHTVGRCPRFSFPASLPPPSKTTERPPIPARQHVQQHRQHAWQQQQQQQQQTPTLVTRDGEAREPSTTDPTAILQQQVAALQAQLAQQQEMLAVGRETIHALELERDRALESAAAAAAGAGAGAGAAAAAAATDGEPADGVAWACRRCTFHNTNARGLCCEMCGAHRA
jgi:hypothetical protein